jgi:hypothetical protein
MEIIIFGIIAFIVYKIFKSPKEQSTGDTQSPVKRVGDTDQLAKTINQLRETRKKQEEQKIAELQIDVTKSRDQLNLNNTQADKMGLRQTICFIVDKTTHWHAWEKNTENFTEKYTDIDDFILHSATKKKVEDNDSRTELDFSFNDKEFKFVYQTKGSYDGTNFGFVEILEKTDEEFEKMLKMDTYMTYGEYVDSYRPGDISTYKIGEWIPAVVSIEAGLQAISKKVSLEMNKKMLEGKFD